MRPFLFLVSLSLIHAQAPKVPPTLKSILLEQLRTSHDQEDWFVPVKIAIEGLTPEQAKWKPAGKDNHSIGQLANHLLFWDERQLVKFKGQPPAKYDGNNVETFNDFDSKSWNETVRKLDAVMTEWEKVVEAADDARLKDSYSAIAHVTMHNAYHVGQILYVRKLQGVWDPAKGVK